MSRWLVVLCLVGAFAVAPSAAGADIHARFESGSAPGPLRLAADDPVTLHVKALDGRGEPFAGGLVQLIRIDAFTTRDLRLDAAGEASIAMGAGTYALFALIYTPERDGDRETVTYTSLPQVSVTGDADIVLDARGGRPVRPPAVRDAVRIDEGAFIYSRGAPGGQWFNTGIFPSVREIERGQVRIKPTGPAATGTYGMLGRWRLYGRGPHGDLFDLALASPKLEPVQRVEPGSLARLDATYRPLGAPATYTEYRTAQHPLVPGGTPIHPLTTEHDLRVPAARREWVSAGPDVRWGQCLRIPVADQPLLRLCEGPRRAYAAGTHERHDRMLMPRPALGQVLRSGSSLLASVAIGEGEAVGEPLDRAAASRLRLYRDGELIGDTAGILSWFPAPPGDARFTVESEQDWGADPFLAMRRTTTRWTAPIPDPSHAAGEQRWLVADVAPRLDMRGRAPAYRGLRVDLRLRYDTILMPQPEPPQPDAVGLWYSIDDGTRWTKARLAPRDGGFRAVIPRRDVRATDEIALRVDASDALGNRFEQTLLPAFPVAR